MSNSLATALNEATAAMQVLRPHLEELDSTVLAGWPFTDLPTSLEAELIQLAYWEISMHEPGLGDGRCWYIAGQIVARFRRDAKSPR